uniref:Uncharacterized protein n=1 Tax=Trypanosoma congolense (strain IL3000) TaxID=1068625 RepID=G0URC0_TRYCI|nr:hypothetical protein, unlikely [Trypanosoma congolense IL3000]
MKTSVSIPFTLLGPSTPRRLSFFSLHHLILQKHNMKGHLAKYTSLLIGTNCVCLGEAKIKDKRGRGGQEKTSRSSNNMALSEHMPNRVPTYWDKKRGNKKRKAQ